MDNHVAALVQVGVAVAMGLLFGFLYESLQPNVNGVWNRLFCLFSEVTFLALLGTTAVGTWQDDRTRFLRERAVGYYGTLPYVGASVSPPVYPTRVDNTPGSLANRASGCQNHPRAKSATSVVVGLTSVGDFSALPCGAAHVARADRAAPPLADGVLQRSNM